MPTMSRLFCASLIATLVISCGGQAGDVVRPKDFTATNAIGGPPPTCTGTPKSAKPLIIDLEPDARVDLEAAMKKGVVIVAYDCVALRVLSTCKLKEGAYDYAGVSRKEQVVQMKGIDELKVNLPLSAGKFGSDVQSGRSIDLGLVYVGRRTTVVGNVQRDELQGTCEGATHYLQSASVGAFSMATGSGGKVAAVAELFSASGSAKSEASRNASTSDGSLEACRTSNPDADAPPPECRAPLRVELTPIAGKAAGSDAPPAKAESKPKGEENPCQTGYQFANGICTRTAKEEGYLCEILSPDCKTQCEKGNLGSCYNHALFLEKEESIPFFKKACEAGHADSCSGWGSSLKPPGSKEKEKVADFVKAVELFKRACDMGSGTGCGSLGYALREEFSTTTFNLASSFRAFNRGCSLGDSNACSNTAIAYLSGAGVPKDTAKGIDFFAKACQSGDAKVCEDFARELQFGANAPKDLERSFRIYSKLCEAEPGYVCQSAVDVLIQLGRYDDAFKMAKRLCDTDASGYGKMCEPLAALYETGKGTKKDATAAQAIYKRICDYLKSGDACDKLNGNKPASKPKPHSKK